jgi:hypothetical protein
VELSDGARLVGLEILEIEASDQVVFAPNMFRHQMNLREKINKNVGEKKEEPTS